MQNTRTQEETAVHIS